MYPLHWSPPTGFAPMLCTRWSTRINFGSKTISKWISILNRSSTQRISPNASSLRTTIRELACILKSWSSGTARSVSMATDAFSIGKEKEHSRQGIRSGYGFTKPLLKNTGIAPADMASPSRYVAIVLVELAHQILTELQVFREEVLFVPFLAMFHDDHIWRVSIDAQVSHGIALHLASLAQV